METLEPEESEGMKMTLQAQEIKRLKNEVEKLKADLRGKDNEINDLKALVDYLRQFRPNKEEVTTQG
jgi:predicted RNase H-like nuclease (RuvC/YqgF family)